MAKNRGQLQKGLSLPECQTTSGTEAQCAEQLFAWRWPNGVVCPDGGHAQRYTEIKTRALLQCKHCRHQSSLTAGTVFAYSKLPLTVWCLALDLLTQQKNGILALELKRQLGVSYRTAWSIEHKLRQVMLERDADHRLTGVVGSDVAYWGGEYHGGTPGRGSPNETPFVAALSKTLDGRPLALRMNVVAGFRKTVLAAWAEQFLDPNGIVVSDGLGCFNAIAAAGIEHQSMVTGGGAKRFALEPSSATSRTPCTAPTATSAPSICPATWQSSATASTAAATCPPCCGAWAPRRYTLRRWLTGSSSRLRLVGNQVSAWRFCLCNNTLP